MGSVSKRQQPDHREDNSRRPLMGPSTVVFTKTAYLYSIKRYYLKEKERILRKSIFGIQHLTFLRIYIPRFQMLGVSDPDESITQIISDTGFPFHCCR